ncbi:UNVERIFIED_CONTAM: hypothetical protein HDU68_001598 [Siphonaria sp. JEL0065]|nr:hypothetical protein HDU68_001598 [Siphonaria sp. JEL0065]
MSAGKQTPSGTNASSDDPSESQQQRECNIDTQQLIWFRLVDSNGSPYRGTNLDAISLSDSYAPDLNLLKLRKLIRDQNAPILDGLVASQMSLYLDPVSFTEGTPLKLSLKVSELNNVTEVDPLIVVVLCRLSQLPILSRKLHSLGPSTFHRRESIPIATHTTQLQPQPLIPTTTTTPTSSHLPSTHPLQALDALNNPIPSLSSISQKFLREMESTFGTNICYHIMKPYDGRIFVAGNMGEVGPSGVKFTYGNIKEIAKKHKINFENIMKLHEAELSCSKGGRGGSTSDSRISRKRDAYSTSSTLKPPSLSLSRPPKSTVLPYPGPKSTASKSTLFQPLIFAYQLAGGIPTPTSALEPAIDPKSWKSLGYESFKVYLEAAEHAGVIVLNHKVRDVVVSLPNQREEPSTHSAIPAPVQNWIFSESEWGDQQGERGEEGEYEGDEGHDKEQDQEYYEGEEYQEAGYEGGDYEGDEGYASTSHAEGGGEWGREKMSWADDV